MISLKVVNHIAKLSRLTLTEQEQTAAQQDLSKILDYMEKLNELDTSGVQPTFADPLLATALREDSARPSMSNDDLMANAPDSEDGAYKVPSVVEE